MSVGRVFLLLQCPKDRYPHYYFVRRTGILTITMSVGRVFLALQRPKDGYPHYYYVRVTGILSITVSQWRVSPCDNVRWYCCCNPVTLFYVTLLSQPWDNSVTKLYFCDSTIILFLYPCYSNGIIVPHPYIVQWVSHISVSSVPHVDM